MERCAASIVALDAVRGAEGAQVLAGAAGFDVVAPGAELGDGGVEIAGSPQDDGVEDQAEGGKSVLALTVRLAEEAA